MLVLASLLLFAQAGDADPFPLKQGCAHLAIELQERVGGAVGSAGAPRAREACYEQLGKGFTTAEVAVAMHAWEEQVAGLVRTPSDPPVPGDAWVEFMPRPRSLFREPAFAARLDDARALRNLGMSYWMSCDGRGRQGACDQMGVASFRLREGYWAQMRYFDLYADNDTAGAVGMGVDQQGEAFGYTAGLWVGTWAKSCDQTSCSRGAPFAIPYLDVHAGTPTLFVEAAAFDGPYIASGHSRLEIGHEFPGWLRVQAGVTAGIFGHGAAARADARLMLFQGHVSVDGYAALGSKGFALGGGLGVSY